MGPNVYGMALFSDGGIFATKPYVCGSNYILKMSDYSKPKTATGPLAPATWCEVMDGLYWRFISQNSEFLRKNARMGQMVKALDRLDPKRKESIFTAAERFIARVTR